MARYIRGDGRDRRGLALMYLATAVLIVCLVAVGLAVLVAVTWP